MKCTQIYFSFFFKYQCASLSLSRPQTSCAMVFTLGLLIRSKRATNIPSTIHRPSAQGTGERREVNSVSVGAHGRWRRAPQAGLDGRESQHETRMGETHTGSRREMESLMCKYPGAPTGNQESPQASWKL